MDIPLDGVIYFDVITSTPTTGAAVDADSTPTFAVYEEATDTDIGVGGNLTKRTSLTGNYRGSFTASAANGLEVGKWYSVIVSATVAGVAGKCVARQFRIVAAETIAGTPKVDAAAIAGSAAAATNWKNVALTVLSGTVQVDGGNTATTFATDLPAEADDYYGNSTRGLVVAFIAGANNKFQTRRITASTTSGGNTVITVDSSFDAVPTDGDAFISLGRG